MTGILRILAVGDELLFGRHLDTNSQHIARRLLDLGLRADRIRIVADDQSALAAELQAAAAGADLVIVTGGLGPTEDDRTRHALAEALGVELVEDAQAWQQVHDYISGRLGLKAVALSNRRQALLPRGSEVLPNDRGTAPGILARLPPAWIACLPGVPHEMAAMLEHLCQRLPELLPGLAAPQMQEFHLAGLGESSLQDQLGLLASSQQITVGITAHETGHITIRLLGQLSQVHAHAAQIEALIGPWRLPGPGLAESLVAELSQRGWQVACAESCTCGNLMARIGAVPGASAVLRHGVVAYHNTVKEQQLGVPAELLARHGAVSEEVAVAMALGMQRLAGGVLAVSTTGIAGPDGGSEATPIGTVWVATVTPTGVIRTQRVQLRGERIRIQQRAAASALLCAWQSLWASG